VPQVQDLVRPTETLAAKSLFNVIEGVPQGGKVLLVMDYDAAQDGEMTPQARVVLRQILHRQLDVFAVSFMPQGVAIAQDLLQEEAVHPDLPGYVAVDHYANLGYLPPHPASLQAFMATPTGGATMWGEQGAGGLSGIDELSLIVLVSAHQEHVRWWIEQVGSRYDVDVVAAVSAASSSYVRPYYSDTGAGQLRGLLVGLAGAASYENMTGADYTPNARENMILLGSAQVLLAAILILSAVAALFRRAGRDR
jgi:hypothetical protein